LLAKENPLHVLRILLQSSFGSVYDLGTTIFYTTPLIFTALSVSIAFRAGLFNIGAEGQLLLGSLAAAATGILFPNVPYPFAPALAVLAAMAAGGIWGFIPGWLRARRGSHEVIVSIMMNFIAKGLASYVTLYLLFNPESQNPETRPVAPPYFIRPHDPVARFFGDAPASSAFVVAIALALALWWFFQRSVRGYEMRAVGANEHAARAGGVDVAKSRILAMTLAGMAAGLVALPEVLGNAGRFRLEFSADYGFMGIAVALLARNHPIGIIFGAFLFGALHKGTADLDLETERVSRDLSLVIQAVVIFSVSASAHWEKLMKKVARL
jgi:simple sugar transport system permease protein